MKTAITVLSLTLSFVTTILAQAPKEVEIRLSSNPSLSFSAEKGRALTISEKRRSKFRLQPGIANVTGVSFEHVGTKGCFLRHANGQLFLHERRNKLNALFNADATFKIVHVESDKFRIETSNYPGVFLTVRDDGVVLIARNPDPSKSTFIFK